MDNPITNQLKNLKDFQSLNSIVTAGEPVAFPTDTLPALACKPEVAAKLWQLKQRPADKPLILMAARVDELLKALGEPPPAGWEQLADQGWPGGLTLVMPASGLVSEALNPGGKSLGLRIPNSPRALELLKTTGPLATTSVNRSGEPACLNPQQIAKQFPDLALLAPLPWPPASGMASTVVAWKGADWYLVREGNLKIHGVKET
jgi:L-threonylcarbamoyladenylate synthase